MNDLCRMPFARLLLPMVVGILLQRYFPYEISLSLFLLPLFFIVLHWLLKKRYSYESRFLFGVGLYLFLMGIAYQRSAWQDRQLLTDDSIVHDHVLVKLIDLPVEKERTMRLLVRMASDSLHTGVKWQIHVKKDSISCRLQEGDWICFHSSMMKRREGANSSFDYDSYLRSKGISGSFYLASNSWMFVGHSHIFSFYRWSHSIQKKLVDVFRNQGIGGDELGVLSALSIGDKTLLDRDLKNSYSSTGASHILAVSGLHVGVVFWVFTQLLSQLFRAERFRKVRVVFSLVALWTYTFVTGLSPSVIRASIMLSMISLASLLNRRAMVYNTVFASAFMMLLYSPNYLFDVGFQLSYVAVLSILVFQKPIYQAFVFRSKICDKAWSLLSVSFAAQLGTMPLTLYYFHQISNVFWLSGFIVIPLSTVIIYLSVFLWTIHWIPYLSKGTAFLLEKSVMCMNFSIEKLESFHGIVCSNVRFEWVDLMLVGMMLGLLAMYVHKKSFSRVASFLIVVFVYSVYQAISQIFFVT